MDNGRIQSLLNEQAECRARIRLIPFDGSIEVKTISGEKYLYARKREGGKHTSTYIDRYSDELYAALTRQAVELRALKKDLRRIEKSLAELGYAEHELSPRVLLNEEADMLSKLTIQLNKFEGLNYGVSSLMQGVLMEHIDPAYAEKLHEQSLNPYSQHIEIRPDCVDWIICTVTEEAREQIIVPLMAEDLQSIWLEHKQLRLEVLGKTLEEMTYDELLERTYFAECPRYVTVEFRTAAAFKVNGNYQFYPTVEHLLMSLIRKHDRFAGRFEIYTDKIEQELRENIQITDYRLRSTRFHLEGVRIPSFLGSVTLRIGGPRQFVSLINMLLAFGEYTGVGIKTGLGMGAVTVTQHRKETAVER
ncbi:MAG: CRISPR system precrRNA processing endoribonuclease RAMP protein Cas6 [Mogibacterium sp.]|nr:CRISPR system precrRNA processing endoribonuclease RAMP protein Cas6 [Mogibacterium sp.]